MSDLILKRKFTDRAGCEVYDIYESAPISEAGAIVPQGEPLGEIRLKQVEQLEQQLARECVWEEIDEPEDSHWESACGEAWFFMEGSPAENNVRFCQGCGGKVVINPPEGE